MLKRKQRIIKFNHAGSVIEGTVVRWISKGEVIVIRHNGVRQITYRVDAKDIVKEKLQRRQTPKEDGKLKRRVQAATSGYAGTRTRRATRY